MLEKLSKDELMIELVRQRRLYRDLKLLLRRISEEEGDNEVEEQNRTRSSQRCY